MSHINLREEKERDFLLAYEEELKELGEDAPFVPRDEIIFRTERCIVGADASMSLLKRLPDR